MSFINDLVGGIRGAADRVGEALDAFSVSIVRDGLQLESDTILGAFLPNVPALWQSVRDDPNTPVGVRNLLRQWDTYPWFVRFGVSIGYLSSAFAGLVSASHSAATTRMMQNVNLNERPTALGPPEALDLYRRHIITGVYAREVMRLAGYNEDDIGRLLTGARTLLDPTAIRDLELRNLIAGPDADATLLQQGYTPTDIVLIKELYKILPPITDIIPMAVKDVFDPEARKRLDLDAEFPADVLKWAQQQGLDEFWARNYWAAHWNLPSPTQAFEMLHRRLITAEQLDDLIRAQDYAPVWRERLRKISYNIPTRVDVRRMYEIEVINRDEMKSLLQDGGYDEANAERLTRFYERLGVEGDISKKKRARDLTLGMMQEAYRDGIVTSEELLAFLKQLNYDDDEARLIVEVEQYKRDRAWLKEFETSVKNLYVKGFWRESDVSDALAGVGYDAALTDRLLRVWINLRDARELTDEEKAQRDLTKADVLDGYVTRSIPRDQAATFLSAMHYDEPEVAVLLANADTKRRKAELKDATDLITLLYVNGQITNGQALIRLDALNLPATQRDALMERLEVERRRSLTKLTLGQIQGFFERKYITDRDVAAELAALGFSQTNVQRFLRQYTEDYILTPEGYIDRPKPTPRPG